MKRNLIIAAVGILAILSMLYAATSTNGGRTIQGTVNFCADAGSTDAYACNLSPALGSYQTGACYTFKANTANTGAATIAFNGLSSPKTIVKVAGGITTTLADNDIRVGQYVNICYDGTNMQMQSLLGNAPTGAAPGGSFSEYQYRSGASTFGALTNTAPVPTTWTLAKAASAICVLDDFSAKAVSMNVSGNATPSQNCVATTALGAAPYTVIAQIFCNIVPQSASGSVCGLVLYDGTKAYSIEVFITTAVQLTIRTRQTATLASAGTGANNTASAVGLQFTVKVNDNGTNRIWSYWSNGSWVQLLSESTATFLTPTSAGIIGVNDVALASNAQTQLLYWCLASGNTCNGQ